MMCSVSSTESLCIFVCVHTPENLFGGYRIIASLILLQLHGINCKDLEVWPYRVSYFFI